MSFIKYMLEIILVIIIVFFVWNILKRIFFRQFYKNFPALNPNNRTASPRQKKEKVNWDAETVEYEEVKEEEKNQP